MAEMLISPLKVICEHIHFCLESHVNTPYKATESNAAWGIKKGNLAALYGAILK